jgi:anti-sigma regulatory factor (Ser/Thr protein kinase)
MPAPNMTGREAVVRLPATISGLAEAGEALRAFLDTLELDPSRRYQVELTFDEIAGNIVRHGQPVSSVELRIAVGDAEAVMTFDDDGVAFDPRAHDTQLPAPGEHAQIGGLGLVLVRTYASRIEYERTRQHHNRLTLAIPLR